jgi:hypothetical protein
VVLFILSLIYFLLGRRKRSSDEFYGRCVSQFVTISSPVKYVTDPDIIVFVTYPMMQRAGTYDFCFSNFSNLFLIIFMSVYFFYF